MSWSYRVIRKARRLPGRLRTDGKSRTVHEYHVHEVYYDKKGGIRQWTQDPVDANNMESVKDLRNALAQMLRDALRYPVLEFKGGKLVERKSE